MSATLDALGNPAMMAAAAKPLPQRESACPAVRQQWSREAFTREQVRVLVRQIFFSGRRTPIQQIVFSGVEQATEVGRICLRVAQDLAGQVPGRVCVVDANLHSSVLSNLHGNSEVSSPGSFEPSHKDWKQVGANLWLVSMQDLIRVNGHTFSPAGLRTLLAELRCEFQYAVIQAPPAGLYNEAARLGQLSDGMVLVLRAHQTRRIAAHNVKNVLQAANVRLLGTVLDQRTFPIPDGIYRRL